MEKYENSPSLGLYYISFVFSLSEHGVSNESRQNTKLATYAAILLNCNSSFPTGPLEYTHQNSRISTKRRFELRPWVDFLGFVWQTKIKSVRFSFPLNFHNSFRQIVQLHSGAIRTANNSQAQNFLSCQNFAFNCLGHKKRFSPSWRL